MRVDAAWITEKRAELGDPLLEIGVLVLDSLALETGERAEAEIEDRLRLDLGELEALHERRPGVVGVLRSSDQRDDLVEVVERDEIALEDVRALERLA